MNCVKKLYKQLIKKKLIQFVESNVDVTINTNVNQYHINIKNINNKYTSMYQNEPVPTAIKEKNCNNNKKKNEYKVPKVND